VADAHAQQETPGIGVGQRERSVVHRGCVARVDIRDARGHDYPLGCREQDRGVDEGLLVGRALAKPDRPETEPLDLSHGLSFVVR